MSGTYPHWLFDGSEIPDPLGHGERAVTFLRRLKHPASTAPGHALELTPWQERIVRRIYGPRDAEGNRIVKEVFLMIPRGNRKTSLVAALALLHLLGPERVPAGQVIFAAADREQASIGFREAADLVRMDRRFLGVTKIHDAFNSAKLIRSSIDGSTLKAVSSDGRAQHGTVPLYSLRRDSRMAFARSLTMRDWPRRKPRVRPLPSSFAQRKHRPNRGRSTDCIVSNRKARCRNWGQHPPRVPDTAIH